MYLLCYSGHFSSHHDATTSEFKVSLASAVPTYLHHLKYLEGPEKKMYLYLPTYLPTHIHTFGVFQIYLYKVVLLLTLKQF